MPPVAFAITTAAASIGTALGITAVGMPLAGTGFLASLWGSQMLASFAVKAFVQIATGVALSALARALAPKPKGMVTGVRTSVQFGESAPSNIILGRYATAGDLAYAGSHGKNDGTPNAYYTLVLELADHPATLSRVLANGAWCSLSATAHEHYGHALTDYREDGNDYLWVKFYDGTQTAADPGLIAHYGDDGARAWEADMIGRGITYAIVTALHNPKIHRGVPEMLFELDGMRLYDPRKDTGVGGTGPQRLNDQSTWTAAGGLANSNPAVQAYNVFLGLRDPITDEQLWGGGVPQADLPLADWFAAMNECDADADGDAGIERQYVSGVEILLEDEIEPADILEEIGKGAQAQFAEAAGKWTMRPGPPGAAVFAFSDDDVIITSDEELDPFPSLDEVFNGITARYPEPEDGWADKEAPQRLSAAYRAQDGGRLAIANVTYPTVSSRAQVQRLMQSALKDQRRFRRHAVVLPPEARALGPLDVVEWTSARHGYIDKQFAVDLVEDLPSGCVALSLREVDPADYDFTTDDILPTSVGFLGRPPVLPMPTAFSVEPATVLDADGTSRRPAIRLNWTPTVIAPGVRYQLRVAMLPPEQLPLIGGVDYSDADLAPDTIEVFAGEPLEVYEGETVTAAFISDITLGTALIVSGILPATAYQLRARYVGGRWSAWMPVTTPNTKLKEADLDDALKGRIDTATEKADAAAADAELALGRADDALDQVATLAGDTISDLEQLLADLGGVDAGDIIATRMLALRALQTGWNADPTFQNFTSGLPDHWTAAGLAGNGAPFAGHYGGGLALDIPTGAVQVTLTAASNVAGQMAAADPEAEWLVLYALFTLTAGDPESLRLRAEWLADGASVWTAGNMLEITAPLGKFTTHGLLPRPGIMQGIEVLVQRPPGLGTSADGVRIYFAKNSAYTTAVDLDIHLIGLRKASEAEIKAGQVPGLKSSVDTHTFTINGLTTTTAGHTLLLNSGLPEGVRAHLEENYLTDVEITGPGGKIQTAITAYDQEMQSELMGPSGPVKSYLNLNYLTKTQVNAGISSAEGRINEELGGRVEQAEIAISDEIGFRASGDDALGGRISKMEARSDPGSIVSNGSFETGDFTGWPLHNSTISIIGRNGWASAMQSCPTAWMAMFDVDAAAARQMWSERWSAKPGDIFSGSFLYATGGTTPRDVTLQLRIGFYDLNDVRLAWGLISGLANASGASWTRHETGASNPAPEGTAYVRAHIFRLAGGAGVGLVTGIEARRPDVASLARITTTEATAASAEGAIATLTNKIEAEFGSTDAFVEESATAVARVDQLASSYILRVKAGEAVGSVEAVAFDNPDGPPLTAYKLDYDYIDLDGKVSARDLIVYGSDNLVPDDQLQVAAVWGAASNAEWTLIPSTAQPFANSLGEVRYTGTGTTGFAILSGQAFPVEDSIPDEPDKRPKLVVSVQMRGDGTNPYTGYMQLQFFDRAGVSLGAPSPTTPAQSPVLAIRTLQGLVEVPVGAVTARFRMVVNRASTPSSMVRFFAPVVRRQTPTVQIADGAITAAKANFTDLGAVVAELGTCTITSSLNFGPGVVLTGAIGQNAVTDTGAGVRTALLNIANDDQWYDLCSYTVNVPAGAKVLLSSRAELERPAEWREPSSWHHEDGWDYGIVVPGEHHYRVLRGTTVVYSGLRETYIDTDPGTGTKVYKLQLRTERPGNSTQALTARLPLDSNTGFERPTQYWNLGSAGDPDDKVKTARVNYAHLVVQLFKR